MIGVWKKPSAERGPKVSTAARQPQATMTAGVRQPIGADCGTAVMRNSPARTLEEERLAPK
jgi:hypothetical protein